MKSSSYFDFLIMIPAHEAPCTLTANQHNRLFANKTPRNWLPGRLAPRTGFEPVTSRLTAGRSTVELSGNVSSYGQLEYTPIGGGASIVFSWCTDSHMQEANEPECNHKENAQAHKSDDRI